MRFDDLELPIHFPAATQTGESIEKFLTDNPTVKRSQAVAVIEAGKQKILETLSG